MVDPEDRSLGAYDMVTFLAPATPLYEKVEMAMQGWFEEIVEEISDGRDAYGCVAQYD